MPDDLKFLVHERSPKFEAAAEIVAVHLRHVLSRLLDPQVVPTRVSNRVKTISSAFRKIREKGRTGLRLDTVRDVENHVTDLAGARVVCDYLSDLVFIHGYLSRHRAFNILSNKTKDYIEHSKYGYRGVHLIVQVQTTFGRAKCEIQLRTMLQHAWAEKNHDLLYKLKRGQVRRVPKQIRTLMEKQSDLLYTIDQMALEIADAVTKIKKKTPKT